MVGDDASPVIAAMCQQGDRRHSCSTTEEGTVVEYVFVLRGRLAGTVESLLHPTSVDVRCDSTEVVVEVRDDSEVYSILGRLERLGMSIVSFEQHSAERHRADAPEDDL